MASASGVAILGMGRGSAELIDLISQRGSPPALVVLDDLWPGGGAEFLGHPVVGALDRAREWGERGYSVALGIANSARVGIRNEIAGRLSLPDEMWLTYVDPAATVSASASVGPGTIIYPGARVAVKSSIGRHALLYYNCVVHHDAGVGDGSVLCAGVLLAGGVQVEEGAYLGIGAIVRPGVRIGKGALVGMGSVVVKDVPDHAVVAGVPARAVSNRDSSPPSK